MYTFDLPVNKLRAARTIAAKTDIRYYLCGVHIDLEAGRIVSTDGHRLFACNGPHIAGASSFIMPNTLIDNVLKAIGKKYVYDDVKLTYVPGESTIQVVTACGTFADKAVDGKFPDWKRVIPQTVTGEVAQYNPDYLADAREALALYEGSKADKIAFRVTHNGTGPGVCTSSSEQALVVVMPLRDGSASGAEAVARWIVSGDLSSPVDSDQAAA